MKKLYYVKKTVETCFVAEEGLDSKQLEDLAVKFLKEEESWGNLDTYLTGPSEIEDHKQLDPSWHQCLPWGIKEDITIKDFVKLQKLAAFK